MKQLCKNKHWKINKEYNINKILYLLIDRPTRINFANEFIWENNKGQWHRDYDLPACIRNSGYVEWYKNHKFHRENNKPAKIYSNGKKDYFINNKFIKK